MNRRDFIKHSSVAASFGLVHPINSYVDRSPKEPLVVGHGNYRYTVDQRWGQLNPNKYPIKDAHEMVIDKAGRIILLTNDTENNVLIYNRDGSLIETWGHDYPGAHGLTIHDENGEEFLYICDNERHQVIKTSLSGQVMMTLDFPQETGLYDSEEKYIPTETTIAENGDIYVADGYGEQFILHYDRKGKLLNFFGGRGEKEKNFGNAHGICIDTRQKEPILLITDRYENKLKRFTLAGEYISSIHLPGAYICRPVISGDNVYLATIWSYDGRPNSGFVTILDAEDKVISAPGGSLPTSSGDKMHQLLEIFKHPHDVCVDGDENVYVCQWNSGHVYPIKLTRV